MSDKPWEDYIAAKGSEKAPDKKPEPPKEKPKEGIGTLFMRGLFGKGTPEKAALGGAAQGGSETDPDEIIRKRTKLQNAFAK